MTNETVPIINTAAGISNAAPESASLTCDEPTLDYSLSSLSAPDNALLTSVQYSSASQSTPESALITSAGSPTECSFAALSTTESASLTCDEYSPITRSTPESTSLTCDEYIPINPSPPESATLTCTESSLEYSSAFLSNPESAFAAESSSETTPLAVVESPPEYANILSAFESAVESAPISAAESASVNDPSPVVIQPVMEQVTDAPVLAMDILQEAAVEASLSDLGLGCATPVGLIQNLLEFMHVGIGMPWWAAIVVGETSYYDFILIKLNEC